MKLEVGMYVRNSYFGIGKINKDYFDSNNKHWFNVQFNCYEDDDLHCGICEQSIGYKASNNIIDLIEIGDYVNGHQVYDDFRADTDDYGNNFIEIGIESDRFLNHYIREDEIKSIVTKEQFESIQYKIQ